MRAFLACVMEKLASLYVEISYLVQLASACTKYCLSDLKIETFLKSCNALLLFSKQGSTFFPFLLDSKLPC